MSGDKSVVAYKAFGAGLVCRGFKYEVGGTYEHEGKVSLCDRGFHACLLPFDVFNYYRMFDDKGKPAPLAKVSVVNPSEVRAGQDSKIVTAKITIEATLSVSEWVKEQCAALVRLVKGSNTAKATTGNSAHSATTGYSAHSATTGNYAHSATTGDSAIAAALGNGGTAQGVKGSWIVLAQYDNEGKVVRVKTAKVGTQGLKAGVRYKLNSKGAFVKATS